ncbi:non-canonical purine NTP pyrophosphatase, partial [Candidatus Pelagibacter sp.]|nr:non-canonical purine NTP pyrophosphatase [Candidatus Pelagibacter sp.]
MLKKKIIKILIGTNNIGKLKEIRDLLPKNLEIYSTSDFKIKSPAENGKTFEENSLIKAKYFSKKSKMICLSDDSGLEIDILKGAPGIYSARWGGKKGNFIKAMKRVFKELDKKSKNWKNKKIKARFVCALTIYGPNQKIINSVGKIEGYISPSMKGENGFGYDPIFIPKGK